MKYNKTELLLEYYNLDMSDYSDFSLKHGGFPEIHTDVKYTMPSHEMMTIFSVFHLPLEYPITGPYLWKERYDQHCGGYSQGRGQS